MLLLNLTLRHKQALLSTGFWQLKIRHLVLGIIKQGKNQSLLLILRIFIEYSEPSLLGEALYVIFSGNFACTTLSSPARRTTERSRPKSAASRRCWFALRPPLFGSRWEGAPPVRVPRRAIPPPRGWGLQGARTGATADGPPGAQGHGGEGTAPAWGSQPLISAN